jgi:hypothetical protein
MKRRWLRAAANAIPEIVKIMPGSLRILRDRAFSLAKTRRNPGHGGNRGFGFHRGNLSDGKGNHHLLDEYSASETERVHKGKHS